MSRTIRVILSDAEWTELKALAARERRTLGAQAAVILHEAIPALRIRRSEDVQQAETHPVALGKENA